MTDYKVIVDKSTVPVGTADKVREAVRAALTARGIGETEFAVVSNPEFLKEGAAVDDCMRPDRIVLGADDERAILLMRALYTPFMRNHDRMQVMDLRSAEFTKYAANAMLATRISFMNELARLAERVGADIEMVRKGIGSDPRIGTHFLYTRAPAMAAVAFPKDVKALIHIGSENGVDLELLRAVESVNERQKHTLVDKITARFGEDLSGRQFALWGLSFKPNTDDMREAPSRVIVHELVRRGAAVSAYDPVAMEGGGQGVRPGAAAALCRQPVRGVGRRRRTGGGHRVEGISQPRLRRHQGGIEGAGDLRRAQHLRAGADAAAGHRLPRHRPRPGSDLAQVEMRKNAVFGLRVARPMGYIPPGRFEQDTIVV